MMIVLLFLVEKLLFPQSFVLEAGTQATKMSVKAIVAVPGLGTTTESGSNLELFLLYHQKVALMAIPLDLPELLRTSDGFLRTPELP